MLTHHTGPISNTVVSMNEADDDATNTARGCIIHAD